MNHKFLKRQMVIYFAWYFLKNFDDLCRRIVADIAEIIMQRSLYCVSLVPESERE